MNNRRSLRKALAWLSLVALLLTGMGCVHGSRADITEKTNTERLEDAAIVTLSYTAAAQPVQKRQILLGDTQQLLVRHTRR